MSDTKLIKNTSSVPQSVVFQGRQITLKPYTEERMDYALADAFLARCAPVVKETSDAAETVAFDAEGDMGIWLANVTGNPKYTKTIPSKSLQNKKWVYTEIENPSAKPHPVVREWDEGQIPYTGRDGAWLTKDMPKVPVRIDPYQRRRLRKDIADWYLRRENNSIKLSGFSAAVIKSRAPTSYEPEADWDLNEIRAYLQLISAGVEDCGPTEAEVANKAREAKFNKDQIRDELYKAKRELLDKCWYYVVDPAHRLPTRAEVKELLTGRPNAELIDAQVERVAAQATA